MLLTAAFFLLGAILTAQADQRPLLEEGGITWHAPFVSQSGYGSEARDFLFALHKLVPDHIRGVQHGDSASGMVMAGLSNEERQTLRELLSERFSNGVHICHSEPGAWHPAKYDTARCPGPEAEYKIGRTMFETDRLPEGWADRCNAMDEVWVPTHFHRNIFIMGGVVASKLKVVPEPVDTDFFNPEVKAFPLVGGEHLKYKFLSVFKWEERKGWKILVKAFVEEFRKSEKVGLYLLTHGYHGDEKNPPQKQLQEYVDQVVKESRLEADRVPFIKVMDMHIPQTLLPGVYKSADCVVIPSRGEGWGRPHVEALSMEKPLIATFWSGPSEFMSEANSYPLRINAELLEITEGPFKGHKWADPESFHLKELMRRVFKNPEAAKEKGRVGRKDMVERYHPLVVAKQVLQRIERIYRLRLSSDYVDPMPIGKPLSLKKGFQFEIDVSKLRNHEHVEQKEEHVEL